MVEQVHQFQAELGAGIGRFVPPAAVAVEFDLGDQGTVTADRLLGLGAYAVVVAEAP